MTDLTPVTISRRKKNRRLGSRPSDAAEGGASPWRAVLGWSFGMMAAAGVTLGAVHGWQALVGSTRLSVHDVDYRGLKRASIEELSAYSGVAAGDPILELELDAMARSLERHPWVASAQVRRELPDRLIIDVREYDPAVIVVLGDLYLATADGELFKRMAAGDGALLPIITGLTRDEADRDPETTRARIREGFELAQVLAQSAAKAGRADELHHDEDLGWSVVVKTLAKTPSSVRLHLGHEPEARLPTALRALERVRGQGYTPAEIFADGQKHPSRVHVRLRRYEASLGEPLIAKAR